jgi:hypothetical protein
MIPGDANGNGQVTSADYITSWRATNGTAGYKAADFNMNGQVTSADYITFWRGNSGKATQVP